MRTSLLSVLILILFIVVGCDDGPNSEVASKVSNPGVHNRDEFKLVVKINNGASITSELNVALRFSALDAAEMYVTQESACNIGGQWEAFKNFKPWSLEKANATNFFYVKVRNSTRESDCAFASIAHDSTAPTIQVVSPAGGSTLADPNELMLIGTCDEDVLITINVNLLASVSTQCVNGMWSKAIDTTLLPSGNIAIQVKGTDQVMNQSSVHSLTYIK